MISPERLALEASRGQPATPSAIDRLARQYGPQIARWAFGQWVLREKAKEKFARADEMLFDRDGLEMATHERVAAVHASFFPKGVKAVDLTCGLGADLIALAARGPAIGFEVDEGRAVCAMWNLVAHGLEAEVVCSAYPSEPLAKYAFADPARRSGGRRHSLRPEDYQPTFDELLSHLDLYEGSAIKLSPMLSDEDLAAGKGTTVFVSFERECREALILRGECERPGPETQAFHLETDSWLAGGSTPPYPEKDPGEWFYEMDPAAIRAHAEGTLCEALGLSALGDSQGYLTGGQTESPWLRRYRVLYHGRADIASTKAELKKLDSKTPIVKQRAAKIDPETIRRQLKLSGGRDTILAVWPVGKSLRHTILEIA